MATKDGGGNLFDYVLDSEGVFHDNELEAYLEGDDCPI